jgi:hypothetical protein
MEAQAAQRIGRDVLPAEAPVCWVRRRRTVPGSGENKLKERPAGEVSRPDWAFFMQRYNVAFFENGSDVFVAAG